MQKIEPESIVQQGVLLAGVDEAGRGPLAGPVVAAAVILDPEQPVAGLMDSKRLTASRREQLAQEIRERAIAWSVCEAGVDEIDAINILQASLLAMSRALSALVTQPEVALIDGLHCPDVDCRVMAVVKGDNRIAAISAASILAKVARDRVMVKLDRVYPAYGFARHKGYPTRAHLEALKNLGPSPVHRRSFAPVQQVCKT